MRRYVIATHGTMAAGICSTVEFIMGPQENLACINAYTKECQDPMPEFQKLMAQYPQDEIVIMTDLMGGSVNNNALTLTGDRRVHVITGISLALVIGMLTSGPKEDTECAIRRAVADARKAIVYCDRLDSKELEEDEF